jgi:hypothetical protein
MAQIIPPLPFATRLKGFLTTGTGILLTTPTDNNEKNSEKI